MVVTVDTWCQSFSEFFRVFQSLEIWHDTKLTVGNIDPELFKFHLVITFPKCVYAFLTWSYSLAELDDATIPFLYGSFSPFSQGFRSFGRMILHQQWNKRWFLSVGSLLSFDISNSTCIIYSYEDGNIGQKHHSISEKLQSH